MAEHNSPHTGEQVDEAVSRALAGGEIDQTHVIKTYGALSQIGLSVGIETMKTIAQALTDNSQIIYSASGGNDVADGSAYPVSGGSAITAGTLFAHRVNANQVFFEFDTDSGVWEGFYNGSAWSGWAKIYDSRNKPTAADVGALPLIGGTLTDNLTISKSSGPRIQLEATGSGAGAAVILGSHNVQLRAANARGSAANYRQLSVFDSAEGATLTNAVRLYDCVDGTAKAYTVLHTGNLAELGGGSYAGLVMLKTLAVEEDEVSELEFQLTAAELTKYKRFVIFPKLEAEYDYDGNVRKIYLEAPTFTSEGISVNMCKTQGFLSNGVAFISVGSEHDSDGWSLRMLALSDADNAIVSESGASTSSYPNPTTDPITFRIYTNSSYPFIKGGTVSIMGVN